ncbi:GTPase activating protein (GAP) for Rho1p [Vermiconidia calcicola]|uniref:GTPase activating protein (GAP) for Rho1p n=1 Tax=Vermiconidia calcicola TaxID=1690605 RepID=A0ACC3MEL6_9PEZI|nr:GTPase activating protein (GAP) for Rho1p [Vermiconidia calcicola]
MAHMGAPTVQASAAGPRTAPQPVPTERSEQKRNLATWWSNFKRSDKKAQDSQAPQGIFGVPLQESIRYANVAISLFNDEGNSYIYGYVPIVVAKCGVFLKEKATDVEGIFRLAGSEKRIKELKVQFDSPDRYGKGLDWTGYTVHDAANILRRYFNQLPEPIIPLDFYERFREPLRNHQAQAVGELEAQSPSVGNFDGHAAIRKYQSLITELPPLNRQLLLYILDLLAVFASKSDLNKMTTANLSAIFQPGILSHPQHDMAPPEYRLSQDVLIFLIENQDSFLIGMQGTEADPETVREVQSGSPSKQPSTPTTPGRSKTIIGRTSSNASVGAESVRRFGGIRRNVSVSSSKRSKKSDGGPTIVPGGINSPSTPTGGVHRSNTVPSRRGGSNAASPRFSRDKNSDPSTPSPGNTSMAAIETNRLRPASLQSTPIAAAAPQFPAVPDVKSDSSSEATTPLAPHGSDTSSALTREYLTPKKDTAPLLSPPKGSAEQKTERSPSAPQSASGGRAFLDIFKQSPGGDAEGRKPNKLQKKRVPGTSLSSAQSSVQSLSHEGQSDVSPRSPTAFIFPASAADVTNERASEPSDLALTQRSRTEGGSQPAQTTPQRGSGMTDHATLRPTASPPQSYHSATESDADMVGDDLPKEVTSPEKEKKRHRWRFSRSQNKLDSPAVQSSPNPLGTMTAQDQTTSRSTVGSYNAQPRRSVQEPTPLMPAATDATAVTPMGSPPIQPSGNDPLFSDSEREKRSGPVSWIRGKLQERKDKEAEKRARTPDRNRGGRQASDLQLPNEALPVRGKSFEQQRAASGVAMSSPTSANAIEAAQSAAEKKGSPSAGNNTTPSATSNMNIASATDNMTTSFSTNNMSIAPATKHTATPSVNTDMTAPGSGVLESSPSSAASPPIRTQNATNGDGKHTGEAIVESPRGEQR